MTKLVEQTKEFRRPEEEIEEENLQKRHMEFLEKNKHRVIKLPDGKKIALSQFTMNPDDLIKGLDFNKNTPKEKKTSGNIS